MGNYQTYTTYDGKTARFSMDSAHGFPESVYFDGRNHISRATSSQWEHESLYRTSSGSWVLSHWSDWQGSGESWQEIDTRGAVEWLLRNGDHAILDQLASESEQIAAALEASSDRGPRAKSNASRAAERIVMRVTAAQKARIAELANAAGQSLTEYVLSRIL